MKCEQFICAEKILKEPTSDQFSIINLLQDISVESFPTSISKAALLVSLIKDKDDTDDETGTLKILINDVEILSHPLKISFVKEKNKSNILLNINGINIVKPGTIVFKIYSNNIELKTYTINVNLRTNQIPKVEDIAS